MSRRKSVAATPESATAVLRRSARLISRKNHDDYQKLGDDLVAGSYPAPTPTEDEEALRKSRQGVARQAPKRLVYALGGVFSCANSKMSPESSVSMEGLCSLRRSPRFSCRGCSNSEREKSTRCNSSKTSPASSSCRISTIASRASCGLNSSNDGSCKLRRSPRYLSGGGSVAQSSLDRNDLGKRVLGRCNTKPEEGSSSSDSSCKLRRSHRFSSGGDSVGQFSSDMKKLGKSVFARCNTKSEKRNGKGDLDSSDGICIRRSCILSESKQAFVACDEGRVSVCRSERKRRKGDRLLAQANESYRQEENVLSSSIFESTVEIAGEGEKKREIVLGLRSNRGTARSSMRSVVKAVREKMIRGDIIDSRGEEDQLKLKNKLDGEGSCGVIHGWTKEQELALQKAYFTAKPSPNFWKKVSKLCLCNGSEVEVDNNLCRTNYLWVSDTEVPGKSSQDCFDKVHSDLITPRQPQPRSRAKKTSLSPIPQFSLSASKLLKPTRPKAKILGVRKQSRNRFAKRTIRHLLEKQCHVDQGHGLDLFSVLEPSTKSYALSTPMRTGASVQKILERSSSAHKKPCSRFTSANTTTLTSPPVLKQIKNKALHEKYIDQLHLREAKRKTESARVSGQENIKPIAAQKKDSVRAVKDNLIFGVKDAFEKLKGLEAEISSSSSELCYDHGESEEEDEAFYL
ncbi:PREDICTED: uncharacterized protein LOC104807657 [Tarenaya hassleriana]|uniref:uncharacterized protein LOC104807657 n=1 Tax=Tarenaya hassleriana TaxID=28532 RepID=UPI00053C4143|nr:PREDICTED: uncharacterized protein LOC104807657 [Tarenaya hassleriana]